MTPRSFDHYPHSHAGYSLVGTAEMSGPRQTTTCDGLLTSNLRAIDTFLSACVAEIAQPVLHHNQCGMLTVKTRSSHAPWRAVQSRFLNLCSCWAGGVREELTSWVEYRRRRKRQQSKATVKTVPSTHLSATLSPRSPSSSSGRIALRHISRQRPAAACGRLSAISAGHANGRATRSLRSSLKSSIGAVCETSECGLDREVA